MMYKELVADFARRTFTNLETLRRVQKEESGYEVFEVTQLINSMLGLLVFPQQKYFDEIPKVPLNELVERGWPTPRMVDNYPQAKDLHHLLRLLRNAISHFNIEFVPGSVGEISGLMLWNTQIRAPYSITWKAELSVEDLEKFTSRFIALILEGER